MIQSRVSRDKWNRSSENSYYAARMIQHIDLRDEATRAYENAADYELMSQHR